MATYSPEMRERVLRMLAEARPDHPNRWTAIRHVAGLLGMSPETLRLWQRRAEVDAGERPGVTSEAAEEIKRLKRENAELRRTLEVADAVSDPRGVLVWSTPSTNERRRVAFPALLVPLLLARFAGKGRDALVFVGADGGVLRNGNWRQRFFDPAVRRVIAQDPGFPKVTPHGLRHTAASLAISAGANVKAVQRMLGHKSAAMVLDTCASLFEDDMESVAVAMDRMAAQESVPDLCLGPVVGSKHTPEKKRENPRRGGVSVVAPTGVDPVTSRFSVERSTN